MAKKLLSITALLSGAIVPACVIIDGTGNPPFDDPDADPCQRDAQVWPDSGNPPPWPDAPPPDPDAQPWPDAAPGARSSPDADPPWDAWPSDDPCNQGTPDADVQDAVEYADSAVGVPDAAMD
jgi:hypothetical protein